MTETPPMIEMLDALDGPTHTSAVCRALNISPAVRHTLFADLRSAVVTDFDACPRYSAVHDTLPEDRAAKLDGLAAKLGLSYLNYLNPYQDETLTRDLRSIALTDMQELYTAACEQSGVSPNAAQELVHDVLANTAFHVFSTIKALNPAPERTR